MDTNLVADRIETENPNREQLIIILNQLVSDSKEICYEKSAEKNHDDYHKLKLLTAEIKRKRIANFAFQLEEQGINRIEQLFKKMPNNRSLIIDFLYTFDIIDFLDTDKYEP